MLGRMGVALQVEVPVLDTVQNELQPSMELCELVAISITIHYVNWWLLVTPVLV